MRRGTADLDAACCRRPWRRRGRCVACRATRCWPRRRSRSAGVPIHRTNRATKRRRRRSMPSPCSATTTTTTTTSRRRRRRRSPSRSRRRPRRPRRRRRKRRSRSRSRSRHPTTTAVTTKAKPSRTTASMRSPPLSERSARRCPRPAPTATPPPRPTPRPSPVATRSCAWTSAGSRRRTSCDPSSAPRSSTRLRPRRATGAA